MAWYDHDVAFDDGGLQDAVVRARRSLAELRDHRTTAVRHACQSWQGQARTGFDRHDRELRVLLDQLADRLVAASADLARAEQAAHDENRRRRHLREQAEQRAREEAAREEAAREQARRRGGERRTPTGARA